MSAHTVDVHEHFAGSNRLFISVWVWLLALTGFDAFESGDGKLGLGTLGFVGNYGCGLKS